MNNEGNKGGETHMVVFRSAHALNIPSANCKGIPVYVGGTAIILKEECILKTVLIMERPDKNASQQ